jgi:hypothetical protein
MIFNASGDAGFPYIPYRRTSMYYAQTESLTDLLIRWKSRAHHGLIPRSPVGFRDRR